MKKTKKITNSDFDRCRKCIYFPDISVASHEYSIDECGVKHRDIAYICQYDLHEIKTKNNKCSRS